MIIGDRTGGSGTIGTVVNLAGWSIPGNGSLVAAEDTFTLGTASLTTDVTFENSDNVTHLLVGGFTGSNGEDLDTNDDGALDATPWSAMVDLIALVEEDNPPSSAEHHYGPPSIGRMALTSLATSTSVLLVGRSARSIERVAMTRRALPPTAVLSLLAWSSTR